LRAIVKTLINLKDQHAGPIWRDFAVPPIAATRRDLDTQQPHIRAGNHRAIQFVSHWRACVNGMGFGVG
jgi:hypothetical protein